MQWAFDQREAGIPLMYRHIILKAVELDDDFKSLTFSKQYHTVRTLCLRNQFVIRQVTHQAQELPEVLAEQALNWIELMRPILSAPNLGQKWIINMDQTPLHLSMHPKRSLNLRGDRSVNGRTTTASGSRYTASIAISANGDKLKPFLIFKGTPKGRIATKELPNNPNRDKLEFCCQKAAWQDEDNMLRWINRVLVPYLQQKARGAPAAILLDHFSAHWTDKVKSKLKFLEVEPYMIPGGCTFLTQPIDVGIGKPFKDHVRAKWWNWMMEQGADNAVVKTASREEASNWVAEAWEEEITTEIVKNSWRRSGFSYFLDE